MSNTTARFFLDICNVIRCVALILLTSMLTGSYTYGQNDSTRLANAQTVLDSINEISTTQWLRDSLTIHAWSDSLHQKISLSFNRDSLNLSKKIDSLERLNLPTARYIQKRDSLVNKKEQLLAEVKNKENDLMGKTRTKLQQWQNKVKTKLKLDSLTAHTGLKIPGLNLPAASPGNLPPVDLPAIDIPDMPSLTTDDFQNLDLSPDLSKMNESLAFTELKGLQDFQNKLDEVGSSISEVSSITKDLDTSLESNIGKIDKVKAVQDEIKVAEGLEQHELMEKAKQLENPEALKQEVQQQVMQRAVDHFAGKEQVLQKAMDQVAKYKQKYSSVNSLSDLPKKRPNEMRGKPLKERLLPGIALQIQRKDDLLVDFNPYVGYRFTGRLTAGLGWNQRLAYSTDTDAFRSKAAIYGPRVYTEFKVWKGFSPRLETEWMNTFVPPLRKTPAIDNGQREWVWSTMAGLKKDYRFIKNVRGTAMVMFNLFNPHRKSPYVDVVNMRFGFEFPLKKKKKISE